MYLKFYGLNREPFHITPDPFFFFLGSSHREAFAALLYALKNKKGFVSITGEVGVGKTTVIRTFLQRIKEPEGIKTILIFNPILSFKNLLKLLCKELDIPLASKESSGKKEDIEFEMIELLHHKLIEEYQRGRSIVLIIDEAQNLPAETLESLRLLSNLETSRDKLIQIFLIGQPELEKKLNLKELRQLKQRIELKVRLTPLTKKEVKEYIEVRLKRAGYKGDPLFNAGALRKIYRYSSGIPRLINVICDNALITGFGKDKKQINGTMVRQAYKEMEDSSVSRSPRKLFYLFCFLLFFGLSFFAGIHTHQIATLFWGSPKMGSSNLEEGIADASKYVGDFVKLPKEEASFPSINATESSFPLKEKKNSLIERMDTKERIIYLILRDKLPFFQQLSPVRQMVLVEMTKDTSIEGLLSFKRMLSSLKEGNYSEAASHMIHSTWHSRVGDRASTLAEIMKNNDSKMLISWLARYSLSREDQKVF